MLNKLHISKYKHTSQLVSLLLTRTIYISHKLNKVTHNLHMLMLKKSQTTFILFIKHQHFEQHAFDYGANVLLGVCLSGYYWFCPLSILTNHYANILFTLFGLCLYFFIFAVVLHHLPSIAAK